MFKTNPKYTAIYHIVIWSLLFGCIFLWRSWNHGMREKHVPDGMVALIGLPYMALFYIHAYWLMPAYLFQKRRTAYILLIIASLLVVVLIAGFIFYAAGLPPAGVTYFQSTVKRIFPGLFILMASASVGAFRENFRLERLRKVQETEYLRTELSFLRGQVNPHFMLNVLNSMALLARRKSDVLEPVLLELARLMNYMLYDAGNQKISLEDEIAYLRAYIDLQLLRFGDDVKVRFDTPEQIPPRCIEPMLFIPLVENAFKHGVAIGQRASIQITIAVSGEKLKFTCVNTDYSAIKKMEMNISGIGLENVKRRLELVYPGKHQLIINKENGKFMVNLEIDLS